MSRSEVGFDDDDCAVNCNIAFSRAGDGGCDASCEAASCANVVRKRVRDESSSERALASSDAEELM